MRKLEIKQQHGNVTPAPRKSSRNASGSLGRRFKQRRGFVVIFGFAFFYAFSSISSLASVVTVINGIPLSLNSTRTYTGTLMGKQLGSNSIYESPLVQSVLANDTSPRSYALYLESNGTFRDACHKPKFISLIYGNPSLRALYTSLVSGAKHAYPFMRELEVIVPVVDCSMSLTTSGDRTRVQYYMILRNASMVNDVYVLSIRFSIQDYSIEARLESGPSGLLVFALFNTMKPTNLTHHFAGSPGFPYSTLSFRSFELQELTHLGFRVFQTL